MKTNAYGAGLDRAGYAPSIIASRLRGRCCCLCGLPAGREKIDRHEPWGGANRQKSKELGLWVELHHWGCHEGPGSVHGGNGDAARRLRADAQTAAMLRYGWSRERWIAEFGKSELSEDECRRLAGIPGEDERTARGSVATPQPAAPAAPLAQGSRNGASGGSDPIPQPAAPAAPFSKGSRLGGFFREVWPERPVPVSIIARGDPPRSGGRAFSIIARGDPPRSGGRAFSSGFRLLPDAELPF